MRNRMDADDLQMIAEGLERILADAPGDAWAALAQNGYPSLCASEAHGGVAASLADAAMLARIAGRHASGLPLADTMLAAGLLSLSGIEPPEGAIALADPHDPDAAVAHATQADWLLRLGDRTIGFQPLDPDGLVAVPDAEDGAGRLTASGPLHAEAAAPAWLTTSAFHALAALMRAAQMAGAMQGVLDLTLGYTQEREQFGRPLARFQAIQHHLSDIACETAAASAAVEMAGDALAADPGCGAATLEQIAIAKIRCGQAASRVAAAAHQAHGAMGFTREYALGCFTRRLWQWQDEFGTEQEWAIRLGRTVLGESDPALWPRISAPV